MRERANNPLRLPAAALVLWMAVPTIGCAAKSPDQPAGNAEPPKPSMNHALHLERDLQCIDCHDVEETGTPSLPMSETCFECHEDLAQEGERVQAYFKEIQQPDGSYQFGKLSYEKGIISSHKGHAEKQVGCADCHGEPSEKAFVRPPLFELKARCMDCHSQKGASNECATCHETTRRNRRPKSHDAAFAQTHGLTAPDGWMTGAQSTCALCHAVPGACRDCHRQTKPTSHNDAGFKVFHGRGDTDSLDVPFAETSCALCHTEQSCVICHQTELPRSHTAIFIKRLHGLVAAVERQSCMTCHKQDYCVRCHQSSEPVNHRGAWASPPYTHCAACHEPLQSTNCFVCHKNTLGHLSTPMPPGAPHVPGANCRACHSVLPHFDDGGDCNRCHR
ncbi:MAG: cytochrome c3 family protein [Planctomycetota bacterium]